MYLTIFCILNSILDAVLRIQLQAECAANLSLEYFRETEIVYFIFIKLNMILMEVNISTPIHRNSHIYGNFTQ